MPERGGMVSGPQKKAAGSGTRAFCIALALKRDTFFQSVVETFPVTPYGVADRAVDLVTVPLVGTGVTPPGG